MTGNGVKQNSEVAGFCKAIHLLPTRKVTYSMMPYATENENCRFKKKKKKGSVPYKNENCFSRSCFLEKLKTIYSPSLLYLNNSYSGAMVSEGAIAISQKNCL